MSYRRISLLLLALVAGVGVTGCKSKPPEEPAATQPAFTEPAPLSMAPEPPPPAPEPAPAAAPKPLPSNTSTSKKPASTSSTSTTATKSSGTTASKSTSTATAKPKAGQVYTVQQGDTLTAIAKRVYGDSNKVKAIVAANPGLDPNKIKVGQKLVLP